MTLSPEVQHYLRRAGQALEVAQTMLQQEYPGPCTSQAYYAMFYAAQALLRSEGIQRQRHSAVEAAFGETFARTRRVDPDLHRALIDGRAAREDADYAVTVDITRDEAARYLADARSFVAEVRALLER